MLTTWGPGFLLWENKMKRGRAYDWIPVWVDKWLMGSTRFELEPGERSVFLDLMILAAKDDGFIRANPDMGYPHGYLSNMLNVSLGLLESSIAKCIKVGKVEDKGKGIYYIKNWNEYSLSVSHKKRLLYEDKDSNNTVLSHGDTVSHSESKYKSKSLYKSKEEEKRVQREEKEPNGIDQRLTQLLIDLMQKNNPESSTLKHLTERGQIKWMNQCRLLREADNRTEADIEKVIRFSQGDSFWQKNILSMPKLREKWDQLWLKAKAGPGGVRENLGVIQEWLDKRQEKPNDEKR
jgi:hypothetical protein